MDWLSPFSRISSADIFKFLGLLFAIGAVIGLTALGAQVSALFLGLLVLALLAGLFVWLIAWDAYVALSLVLLSMPFHTIVQNRLEMAVQSETGLLLFSTWKELALLAILAVVLASRILNKTGKLTLTFELLVMLVFAAWGFVFILTANSLREGVLEYRNIYEGLLILLVMNFIRPPTTRVFKLLDWMVLEGVLISIWGVVTRFVIDFLTYLITFGFLPPETTRETLELRSVYSISGNLFVRANSIFSGPNELGLYLATLIVPVAALLLYRFSHLTNRQRVGYLLALPILLTGEMITISRNAWLLVAVALLVLYLRMRFTRRKFMITLLAAGSLIGLLMMVENLWRFIRRTVNLWDTSAAARVVVLENNLQTFFSNPLGIGLGNASYKLYRLTEKYQHTEFYVFIIGLELGWIGLLLYFLVIGVFVRKCFLLTKPPYPFERRLLGLTGLALLLGTFVSQFTAAISMEWIFQIYLWFFVGAAVFIRREDRPYNAKHLQPDHMSGESFA